MNGKNYQCFTLVPGIVSLNKKKSTVKILKSFFKDELGLAYVGFVVIICTMFQYFLIELQTKTY